MPIINIKLTDKYSRELKTKLFDACATSINQHTGTSLDLIYVFVDEYEKTNARKSAPVVNIDWTENAVSRSAEAKKKVMSDLTDALYKLTNCNRDEIVVIINELPSTNTCLGGFTRAEKN